MKRAAPVLLAALPGIVLAGLAVSGVAPGLRDLPTYFAPLRERTAQVLSGAHDPFWNPDVGCGEPYFANPQTGLLYPPSWLALVLPARMALGLEAGLHLALLGAGCALLARRLAARPVMQVAAGIGAALAGPVVDAVGVINNLATLAWSPWLWSAALAGSVPGVAVTAALAFLGAEPQLAALAALIALTLAPTRRTCAGLALAAALVAVQAMPFAFWVAAGDRGPGALSGPVIGALRPAEALALVLPGVHVRPAAQAFVLNLAVATWVLALGVAALFDRGPVRRLAAWGVALVGLAMVPALPLGAGAWHVVTLGMLRYPARLLFPAVVALAVAAACSTRRAPLPVTAVAGALLAALGLVLGGNPPVTVVQTATAVLALASPWTGVAALAGSLALIPRDVAHLALSRPRPLTVPCLAAHTGGRFYSTPTTAEQAGWVDMDPARAAALGWGYTVLFDERRAVRSFAPLAARSLLSHIDQADQGPSARWWLDSLAAERVVSTYPITALPELCREAGLHVQANPSSWPEMFLARGLPRPGERPEPAGEVLGREGSGDRVRLLVRVDAPRATLVTLTTPDPGWRWSVDGRAATVELGAGIIHGIAVGAGAHAVEARYRPPGLWPAALVSMLALLVLGGLAWRGL